MSDKDPEEFTGDQGILQLDQEITKLHKANKARVACEGKERRRLWAQRKTPKAVEETEKGGQVVSETETPEKSSGKASMLPNDIVQLLAAREKQVFLSDSEDDEKTEAKSSSKKKKKYKISGKVMDVTQYSLRTLALLSTLAAIPVIATNKPIVEFFFFVIIAKFSYSSALRFLVGVDGIVCLFSALSMLYFFFLRRWESKNNDDSASNKKLANNYFLLYINDAVMCMLSALGISAAMAIRLVAMYGESRLMQGEVCSEVPRFCNRMIIGASLPYGALFAYFALILLCVDSNTSSTHTVSSTTSTIV